MMACTMVNIDRSPILILTLALINISSAIFAIIF